MKKEHKVTGRAACAKILERRFEDVVRLYVSEDVLADFRPWLKRLSQEKKAYHVVSEDDLRKVSESMHHEGVCVLVRTATAPSLETFLSTLRPGDPAVVVYLENVGNPHNLGAITRVAAHFGAAAVLVDADEATRTSLSSAAFHRTAEGGAEIVPIFPLAAAKPAIASLRKAGFTFLATSSHANRSLFGKPLPERLVVLLGSESSGLTAALANEATLVVSIPGTGEVESLNVACATSALLCEYYRQHVWTRRPS
ncbi:MAG: rRNA methyltransferase [Silvanigrellales bacterium]|nr:rRNA methyltransferase [Silvanigrellales bacterium]